MEKPPVKKLNRKKSSKKGGPAYQSQQLLKLIEKLEARIEINEMEISELRQEWTLRFGRFGRQDQIKGVRDLDLKVNNVTPLLPEFSGYID